MEGLDGDSGAIWLNNPRPQTPEAMRSTVGEELARGAEDRVWYPRPYERRKLASVTLVKGVHARGGAPPSSEEAIAAGRAVGRLRKGEGELAAAIGGDGAHCWGRRGRGAGRGRPRRGRLVEVEVVVVKLRRS